MRVLKPKLAAPLLLLLAAWTSPASAADFRVTRYDDPVPGACLATDCSLREAAIAASATNDSDRILLSAGTYSLTRTGSGENDGLTGDLDVRGDVEILGAGATMTTIDANQIDRVLHFSPFGESSARLEDVSITGGLAPSGGGGAVSMLTGLDLTIERCEIYDNSNGVNNLGAIYLGVGSTLILRDSTLWGNLGGGINVIQGEVQIYNSTFVDNDGAELQMNAASGYCNHCTFRDTIPSALTDVWVTANSDLELANSVVIGDCALQTGGSITSFGGNLESPGTTCDLDHGTDQDGVASPGFGAMTDNGGPTRTLLPSVTSPAVSGANDALCPPTDQRGAERPDTNCDAGAVERVTLRPPTPLFADGFEQRNGGAWSLFLP